MICWSSMQQAFYNFESMCKTNLGKKTQPAQIALFWHATPSVFCFDLLLKISWQNLCWPTESPPCCAASCCHCLFFLLCFVLLLLLRLFFLFLLFKFLHLLLGRNFSLFFRRGEALHQPSSHRFACSSQWGLSQSHLSSPQPPRLSPSHHPSSPQPAVGAVSISSFFSSAAGPVSISSFFSSVSISSFCSSAAWGVSIVLSFFSSAVGPVSISPFFSSAVGAVSFTVSLFSLFSSVAAVSIVSLAMRGSSVVLSSFCFPSSEASLSKSMAQGGPLLVEVVFTT